MTADRGGRDTNHAGPEVIDVIANLWKQRNALVGVSRGLFGYRKVPSQPLV